MLKTPRKVARCFALDTESSRNGQRTTSENRNDAPASGDSLADFDTARRLDLGRPGST